MSELSSLTRIYRLYAAPIDAPSEMPDHEEEIGFVSEDGVISRLRWGNGTAIGRVDDEGRVFRTTAYGEREVGQAMPNGVVQSAGLFAGGETGWVAADGYVTQTGLILGDFEVGRVEGPRALAAGAALLLIFLPDEREAAHASRE